MSDKTESKRVVTVSLPIRTVPESIVDGRPTINTLVRRIASAEPVDVAATERAVREALY